MTKSLIAVNQLYWQAGSKPILDNISFDVNVGEFIGVIGPNGAGKSTLLRCLYRYLKPSSGKITLGGVDIGSFSQRQFAQQVAVVTQQAPTGFTISVREFMTTGFIANQRIWQRRDEMREKAEIDKQLQWVGLLDDADKCFSRLSGGEQQRILIARAMLQQPSILILDEPTNHLDVHYQIEVLELVRSLGVTVLASIHDLNLAAAYCDRLLLIDNGCLVNDDIPRHVLTEQCLNEVFNVAAKIELEPNFCIRYQFPFSQRRQQ